MNADTLPCAICEAGAIDTPATHTNDLGEPVCDFPHALPGDVPLAGAVAAAREAAWQGHDEPRASAGGGGGEGA